MLISGVGNVPLSHSKIRSHLVGPGESLFHDLQATVHAIHAVHRDWSKKNPYCAGWLLLVVDDVDIGSSLSPLRISPLVPVQIQPVAQLDCLFLKSVDSRILSDPFLLDRAVYYRRLEYSLLLCIWRQLQVLSLM